MSGKGTTYQAFAIASELPVRSQSTANPAGISSVPFSTHTDSSKAARVKTAIKSCSVGFLIAGLNMPHILSILTYPTPGRSPAHTIPDMAAGP
jgi:hypothetical protein